MLQNAQQFLDACRPFGYPLLACSLLMTAAIFYRLLFSCRLILPRRWRHATSGQLRHLCEQSNLPLAREVVFALNHLHSPLLESVLESRLALLIDQSRSGMSVISVITNIAPMLGILGTAWGLVDIFGVFGTPEAQEGIAMGISKALYTTIFGLAIAVPGTIALACFERQLERRSGLINAFFAQLLSGDEKQ